MCYDFNYPPLYKHVYDFSYLPWYKHVYDFHYLPWYKHVLIQLSPYILHVYDFNYLPLYEHVLPQSPPPPLSYDFIIISPALDLCSNSLPMVFNEYLGYNAPRMQHKDMTLKSIKV